MLLAAAEATAAVTTSGLAKVVNDFFANPLTLFGVGMALLILFFWYFATEIEKTKRNVGTFLLFGICALCLFSIMPPKERLKGGIDIRGGSSFSLKIQPRKDDNGTEMPVTAQQAEQAKKVIQKRLDAYGNKEAIIATQGADSILVQMPAVGPEESEAVRQVLQKVAKLELREVSKRNDEVGADGKTLAQRVAQKLEIVPGYQAYIYKHKDEEGNELQTPILLNKRIALGGSDIAQAFPSPQQADAVSIVLNGPGTDKMIALTMPMTARQDRIAIVLDGEVISAPVVNSTPLGKDFIIEGLNEPGEVQSLASALMNPLENALKMGEMRKISPSLGEALVKQGIWAGIIGISITALFMMTYYRLAGIIAIAALAVNAIILFGVMAMFGFTFSLPGIAGMILTIGMAVDANVLIYERLREEMASGKSLKNAIDVAYEKAFSAIFDSNITSLITASILFIMASGAVKGFAVTLTIGILASLFSAILGTRVLFRWGVDLHLLRNKLTFFNLIQSVNFDFLGKRRICAVISLSVLVLSLVTFGVRRERALGVDFTGGTLIRFELGHDVEIPVEEVNQVIATLEGQLSKASYAQEESNPATGALLTIRCATDDPEKQIKDTSLIIGKLRESIPALGKQTLTGDTQIQFNMGRTARIDLDAVNQTLTGIQGQLSKPATAQVGNDGNENVLLNVVCASDSGQVKDSSLILTKLREAMPTLAGKTETLTPISVYALAESREEVSALIGGSYLWESLLALGLGLIGILIYVTIRFEFSFALGGFIAILHDVVISLGLVVLLGGELSLIHVGAILTIAGYSINDTIVVFDRIRENLFYRTGSIKDIMNEAINATLSRTLLTSGTTILTVAVLSLFGGSSLRDFSVMILIGLVVGTYSSIFVAAPIVLWWSGRKGGNLRDDIVTASVEQEILALEK
ncbi:MAG: protein translocase subunit SecD [Akkermansiaceae bacterium]|nr:protein translocase subunit SecD [Akkermansiaceae bacterium]